VAATPEHLAHQPEGEPGDLGYPVVGCLAVVEAFAEPEPGDARPYRAPALSDIAPRAPCSFRHTSARPPPPLPRRPGTGHPPLKPPLPVRAPRHRPPSIASRLAHLPRFRPLAVRPRGTSSSIRPRPSISPTPSKSPTSCSFSRCPPSSTSEALPPAVRPDTLSHSAASGRPSQHPHVPPRHPSAAYLPRRHR
jgi:hypothetical protein